MKRQRKIARVRDKCQKTGRQITLLPCHMNPRIRGGHDQCHGHVHGGPVRRNQGKKLMLDLVLKKTRTSKNHLFPVTRPPLFDVASRKKREAVPAGPGGPANMTIRRSAATWHDGRQLKGKTNGRKKMSKKKWNRPRINYASISPVRVPKRNRTQWFLFCFEGAGYQLTVSVKKKE